MNHPRSAVRMAAASLLLTFIVGATVACSATPTQPPATTSANEAAPPAATSTSTPTPQAEPVPLTAAEVASELAEGDANISEIVEITESNDPNELIGRPNGYSEAAVLYDSRAACDDLGVNCGMTLEVWPTADGATQRSEYILELQREAPILGSEYHTVRDNYLLRVTGDIVPSEATAIAERFGAIELTRIP